MTLRFKITQTPALLQDGTLVVRGVTPKTLCDAILKSTGADKFKLLHLLQLALPSF